MRILTQPFKKDFFLLFSAILLVVFGLFILNSLSPEIFPQYYIYVFVAIVAFYIIYYIGFDVFRYFSLHLYIIGILLLILTLIVGRISRGAVRWVPVAGVGIQSSEIIRPFIILFYANLAGRFNGKFVSIIELIVVLALPVVLIGIQPSLGVSIITFIGLAVIFAVKVLGGKKIVFASFILLALIPSFWFVLKPYQKERLKSFINYQSDTKGSGYNTIQSIISIGSGGLIGRGFHKGFQTQLQYLPEKHTDFIFAGVSEEMGFLGSSVMVALLFLVFFRIISYLGSKEDEVFKLFALGIASVFFVETMINIGMNLGLLPITGLPLPFVSAGGSSLLSSMISISLLMSGRSERKLL